MVNNKTAFTKLPKSLEEQLDTLIKRGMQVKNPEKAIFYLKHTNYYRLEAYWSPYESSRKPHKFSGDADFDIIIDHYLFDRELRLLLLDIIERFEVSFRSVWAYHISHELGPHGYFHYSKESVKNKQWFNRTISELGKQIKRSDEAYIKHYNDNYIENFPPIWVSCEVMSLSLISRFYSNLRVYKLRRKISSEFDFDESFLEGFLEHLTYIRNICAHHSRLWNRHLIKKMPLPRNKPSSIKENIFVDNTNSTEYKIYNTLVILQHISVTVFKSDSWAKKLSSLILHHGINEKRMGFPSYWKALPIWKEFLE